MFGYVTANLKELTDPAKKRYQQVYCGICQAICHRSGQTPRLCLSYDMAFLALLLMSLYEPEETLGSRGCILHPQKSREPLGNAVIDYAADMNVALAYYKALDDKLDEQRTVSAVAVKTLEKHLERIKTQYPRQCRAMEQCIRKLRELEKTGCDNPDLPAGCFGELMGQLLVYQEDLWTPTLEQMGRALGRYIYLADAAADYRHDQKKGSYNPFIAMGMAEDREKWKEYLVLTMARCTDYYERLPLVQDKDILDNILYSGIWVEYGRRMATGKKDREDQI